MAALETFVQVELPKRMFSEVDGAPGQVPVRSNNPTHPREMVWVDMPGIAAPLAAPAGPAGVSGLRAVMLQADGTIAHADPALADRFIGISKNSAAAGSPVEVVTKDTISEPTWTWTPGLPMFFVADGILTQTPPTTVSVLQIGTAFSPTVILISPLNPVFLGA